MNIKIPILYPIIIQNILGYFYPDVVNIQSRNRETLDLHGKRLGDYLKQPHASSEGRPVWRQDGGCHVLSYNDQGEWEVSRTDWVVTKKGATTVSAAMKTETTGLDRIPSSGWMMWDSKQWKPDMELQVLGRLNFVGVPFQSVTCRIQLPRIDHHIHQRTNKQQHA